jgi:hypothetical protein
MYDLMHDITENCACRRMEKLTSNWMLKYLRTSCCHWSFLESFGIHMLSLPPKHVLHDPICQTWSKLKEEAPVNFLQTSCQNGVVRVDEPLMFLPLRMVHLDRKQLVVVYPRLLVRQTCDACKKMGQLLLVDSCYNKSRVAPNVSKFSQLKRPNLQLSIHKASNVCTQMPFSVLIPTHFYGTWKKQFLLTPPALNAYIP